MGSIQASGGNLELTKSVIDDTRSLDRLRRMGGSADSSSREAALRQAATQFETIFTREMFKEMRKAGEDINPDGIGTSHTDKLYQGMLDDQIIAQDAERRASSSSGELGGLAGMVVRQFDRNHSGRKLDSIGESAGNTSSVSDTKGAGNSPAAGSQGVSARHLSRFHMPNETRAFSLDGYMGAVTNGKPASAMSFIENASAQKSFAAGAAGTDPDPDGVKAAFVEKLMPIAKEIGAAAGLNPIAIVAQAALETGWGRHTPGGSNLFGIKAGGSWKGGSVAAMSPGERNGRMSMERAAFRAYSGIRESMQDYADLITGNSRYAKAANAGSVDEYFEELQKAGYATDSRYAEKLKGIVRSGAFEGYI